MSKAARSMTCMLFVVGLFVCLIGCATPYHDYADCCIPYKYCTPAPLRHVFYEGCHCPTPEGSRYPQEDGGISASDASVQ